VGSGLSIVDFTLERRKRCQPMVLLYFESARLFVWAISRLCQYSEWVRCPRAPCIAAPRSIATLMRIVATDPTPATPLISTNGILRGGMTRPCRTAHLVASGLASRISIALNNRISHAPRAAFTLAGVGWCIAGEERDGEFDASAYTI